jgi:hypothetical protein
MKAHKTLGLSLFAATGLTGLALIFAGCESSDTTVRNVSLHIAGLYKNPGGDLVENNTGAPVRQMNLTQRGDQLTGVDNNGIVFRGSLFGESGNQGSVTLKGNTASGAEATISGQIFVNGNKGVLQGTWIEPTLYSTVYGEASVVGVVTNAPPATNQTQSASRF